MTDYTYVKNFEKLGMGLFVHFGLYSMVGRGEWYLKNCSDADLDMYNALPDKFVVKKNWAKQLVATAKRAGAKYINITTRHHDGFSLYDTRGLSDFDAPHSACGRDLIAELADECHKADILPFFYHTLIGWHEPTYKTDFSAYLDYLNKSIEILCTHYGKVGGFWFDGFWDKPDCDYWQFDRLYGTIRKYQPTAMIINNTGLNATGQVSHKEIDSVTFERGNPCFVDNSDRPRAGETCEGMNDHWGYASNDFRYKPVERLIDTLLVCRENNCNLLLNAGLRGDGTITPIEREMLGYLGKWIKLNKAAVYNAQKCDVAADNAVVITDGKWYYAVAHDVAMSCDINVARAVERKHIIVHTDKKVTNAGVLDNGEKVAVTNNEFDLTPFAYGNSMYARVVRFRLN